MLVLSPLGGAGAQFFDNSGSPLSGGKLYVYDAGTTTPQTVYTDDSGTVSHANPVTLDSAGRIPSGGQLWLDSETAFKFVLKTAGGTTLATWDNVSNVANKPSDPAGIVAPYAGSSAPDGWLLCDGSTVSRTSYARLFAAIGVLWGAGDGSTTFKLPDLRGRVPVGAGTATGAAGATDHALGSTGGEETHTLTESEMPSHTHTFNTLGIGYGAGPVNAGRGRVDENSPALYWEGYALNNTGGGSAHNNMPPFATLNYIIRY